ncbi:MAG: hypothetical protein HKN32_08015, partial [Flavobacteriales bacterium]|nr:hypothetical protein [Flavobacteriales bacterium]
VEGSWTSKIIKFDGKVLQAEKGKLVVMEPFSTHLFSHDISELDSLLRKEVFIETTVELDGKSYTSLETLGSTKDLNLQPTDVLMRVQREDSNTYSVILQANTYVEGVWLESETAGDFSNNLLTLTPGNVTEVLWNAHNDDNPEISIRYLNQLNRP